MKKKLLSVVLAVAVAFTFSFAMVGTASADQSPLPGSGADVTAIDWNAAYSSAEVTFEDDGVQKSYKVDAKDDSEYGTNGVDKYGAVKRILEPLYKDDYDFKNGTKELRSMIVVDITEYSAIKDNDPWETNVEKTKAKQGEVTDAADYSAYLETKGDKTPYCSLEDLDLNVDEMAKGSAVLPEKAYSVTYPEYAAFEPECVKNAEVTITDAWAAILPDNYVIADTVEYLPFYIEIKGLNEYYSAWELSDVAAKDWANKEGEDYFIYDGKEHKPVLSHPSVNTTVTYAGVSGEKAWTKTFDTKDFTDVAPVAKNVDNYQFALKVRINNTNYSVASPKKFYIEKRPARVYTTNKVASKVYDGVGIETEFSTDDYTFVNVIDGETLITGIEKTKADVGVYTVLPVYDEAVKANYALDDKEVKAEGTITKADNDIHVNSKTLSIKRGSKKTLSASADFGDVTFQKTGGTSKIYVSKTGVVKVYKSAKKGKTYSVKVKASVKETKNYAGDSKNITLKIKVK